MLCVCKAGKASEKKLKSEAKYVVRCKNGFNRVIWWSRRLKEQWKPTVCTALLEVCIPQDPQSHSYSQQIPLSRQGRPELAFPIHLMDKSQALVRHQKATRRKPAQPQGLEVGSHPWRAAWLWSPSCCWEILLGCWCLKCWCTRCFSFWQGLFIVGINPGLPFGCLGLSFKDGICAVQL